MDYFNIDYFWLVIGNKIYGSVFIYLKIMVLFVNMDIERNKFINRKIVIVWVFLKYCIRLYIFDVVFDIYFGVFEFSVYSDMYWVFGFFGVIFMNENWVFWDIRFCGIFVDYSID